MLDLFIRHEGRRVLQLLEERILQSIEHAGRREHVSQQLLVMSGWAGT